MVRVKKFWPPQNSLGLRVASGAIGAASGGVALATGCGLIADAVAVDFEACTTDTPEATGAWLGATAAMRIGAGEAASAGTRAGMDGAAVAVG